MEENRIFDLGLVKCGHILVKCGFLLEKIRYRRHKPEMMMHPMVTKMSKNNLTIKMAILILVG